MSQSFQVNEQDPDQPRVSVEAGEGGAQSSGSTSWGSKGETHGERGSNGSGDNKSAVGNGVPVNNAQDPFQFGCSFPL